MKQPSTTVAPPARREPRPEGPPPPEADIATILSRMTYPERVRAYRSRAFSPHELFVAAAHDPRAMPMLNGEFEWIAFNAE